MSADALRGNACEHLRNFLLECLREWPSSHALLRAIECRKLFRFRLDPPVLDLGCGTGYLTGLLFAPPVAAGVDINHHEVLQARRRGHYQHLAVADATNLPFVDGYFASVFSNCVLEHLPDLERALTELRRVTRRDGQLLATVPTPDWERWGPFPSLRRLGLHGLSDRLNAVLRRFWNHITLDTQDGWRKRLATHGFELVAWEPYMTPDAYASYARLLPFSSLSLVTKRVMGRHIIDGSIREPMARYLAQRLWAPYVVDGPRGSCAVLLARRR